MAIEDSTRGGPTPRIVRKFIANIAESALANAPRRRAVRDASEECEVMNAPGLSADGDR
jgi:hypothetical protein